MCKICYLEVMNEKEDENFKLRPHRVDGSPYNLQE